MRREVKVDDFNVSIRITDYDYWYSIALLMYNAATYLTYSLHNLEG